MANINTLKGKITNIANAIREKTSTTNLYTLDQMPEAIKSIETGGPQLLQGAPVNFETPIAGYFTGKAIEVYQIENPKTTGNLQGFFVKQTNKSYGIPSKITIHPYLFWNESKTRYEIFTDITPSMVGYISRELDDSGGGITVLDGTTNNLVECIKIQLPKTFGTFANQDIDTAFGYYTTITNNIFRMKESNLSIFKGPNIKYLIIDVGDAAFQPTNISSTLASANDRFKQGQAELLIKCSNFDDIYSWAMTYNPNMKISPYKGVDPM